MYILHVSTALSWRGGEQQIAYLIQELLQYQNLQQHILCAKDSAMQHYCQQQNLPHTVCKKISSFNPIFAYALHQLSKKAACIVHLHDAHAHNLAVLAALLFNNKATWVLSRKVDFKINNNFFSRYKYNHKNIAKILCVSKKIKKILEPAINQKKKLCVIYDGIDTNKFKPENKNNNLLKNQYNIPIKQILIGNVAALAPHKCYFTFIDTAKVLIENKLNAIFFIIGEGNERHAIEKYIEKINLQKHIILTGFRKDIPLILPELDYFLCTSSTEGLGSSILDAFACQVPVVATNAGGIPEIVIHNKTGLLSPVYAHQSLANNILYLINNKHIKQKIVQNAATFVQQFDKKFTAQQTYKCYQQVLYSK